MFIGGISVFFSQTHAQALKRTRMYTTLIYINEDT